MAVTFDDGRITLPALLPILRVPDPPFPRAILTDLPVFWVRGDLSATAIEVPAPLAVRFAAD